MNVLGYFFWSIFLLLVRDNLHSESSRSRLGGCVALIRIHFLLSFLWAWAYLQVDRAPWTEILVQIIDPLLFASHNGTLLRVSSLLDVQASRTNLTR